MLQGSGNFVCSLPAWHHIGMGEKVRTLKGQKAEKAVIRAEVTKLLERKKRLSLAEGKNLELAPTKGMKNPLLAPNPS
ncbi:methionine--tRNA ligase, cytoplasmic-like isoform 1-T2 [Salvelinus alpinus]